MSMDQPRGPEAYGPCPAPARSPTFFSSFPGLPKGRPRSSSILLGQMLSKARRPAAAPPHGCILPTRPLGPRSREPGAGYSEPATDAALATHTQRSAWRQQGKARGGVGGEGWL